jgi:hypothetical protein
MNYSLVPIHVKGPVTLKFTVSGKEQRLDNWSQFKTMSCEIRNLHDMLGSWGLRADIAGTGKDLSCLKW